MDMPQRQYLEFDRRYYVMILTMKKASPRVLQACSWSCALV